MNIKETVLEVLYAIIPVVVLISILQLTVVKLPMEVFVSFIGGSVMVVTLFKDFHIVFRDVAFALAPLLLFCSLFQFFVLRLPKRQVIKMMVSMVALAPILSILILGFLYKRRLTQG